MQRSELPQPNFIIGQMADNLVDYTIDLCSKSNDKKNRFPYKLYNTYVDMILETALTIQKNVFLANSLKVGYSKRQELQEECVGNCIYLCHLIRISFDKGWVSEKQRDRWISIVLGLKYKIANWTKLKN